MESECIHKCRTSIIGIFDANNSAQSRRLPQNQSKQGYEMVTNFLQKNDHFRSVIERLVRGSRGQLDQSVMVCHLRPVLFGLDFFTVTE